MDAKFLLKTMFFVLAGLHIASCVHMFGFIPGANLNTLLCLAVLQTAVVMYCCHLANQYRYHPGFFIIPFVMTACQIAAYIHIRDFFETPLHIPQLMGMGAASFGAAVAIVYYLVTLISPIKETD